MLQPQIQSSTLPPVQPAYILRGHAAQVHALHFLRENSRLLSGDAEGWVILWDVATKRAVAVWKAHGSAILGLGSWGEGKIVSHGRDNSLKVWQLRELDEDTFSTILPVEDSTSHRKEPWLLHSLTVNTLNFCAFSMCYEVPVETSENTTSNSSSCNQDSVIIAVPGLQEGFVNIMQLPSEERLHTVPAAKKAEGGMIMALKIFFKNSSLYLITGHESGVTTLQVRTEAKWETIFTSSTHTQPILSLDISPDLSCYFTSGADSVIGMHSIEAPSSLPSSTPTSSSSTSKTIQTKHSGQQSLTMRSDGKIFATAGWDARLRVYSAKTLKELAVLKWHKEGCYSATFAEISVPTPSDSKAESDSSNSNILSTRSVRQRRVDKAKETHWLAAGSKDGKVSLWDIY